MVLENPYLNEEDFLALAQASEFSEVGNIAVSLQERYPQPLCQVCGPISTGGAGSIEKNLAIFSKTIAKLLQEGHQVFNQMPLEKDMMRIRAEQDVGHKQNNLLEGVYRPLFASGLLTKLFFIHGWESSQGANWELERAKEYGIEVEFLEKDFLEE